MTVRPCWCGEPEGSSVHRWSSFEAALCDPDGVVRHGVMHHGGDYECTGHAHWAGLHIRCTSPAHAQPAAVLAEGAS